MKRNKAWLVFNPWPPSDLNKLEFPIEDRPWLLRLLKHMFIISDTNIFAWAQIVNTIDKNIALCVRRRFVGIQFQFQPRFSILVIELKEGRSGIVTKTSVQNK